MIVRTERHRQGVARARGCDSPFSAGAALLTRFMMAVAILGICATGAFARNPGDPLFCQPQEGTTYLITNGGTGVFTADADCFANNPNNNTSLFITSAHGTLVGTNAPGGTDYVYNPTTGTFVGLDTFSIPVTTVWNSAGGTGSAGGTARPGGPATLNVTLNVIPGSVMFQDVRNLPFLLPVPAGSVTGCTPPGNAGRGPSATDVVGCITQIATGFGAISPTPELS